MHTIKRKTESVVVASMGTGLEVNADVIMSRDQNAGRSRNIKTDNWSFERLEEFK